MKDHYGIMVSIGVWPVFFSLVYSEKVHPRLRGRIGARRSTRWSQSTCGPKTLDQVAFEGSRRIKDALAAIYAVALEEGCTSPDLPIYSNTTLADTPLTDIYHDNLQVLSQIRQIYDPDNVMGRSGGFIIPLPGGTGL